MRGVGKPAPIFCDLRYRTIDSWSRERRVVGKAEHTPDGANPRFIVTSLKRARFANARALYEDLYCARGEAENRIGEQFELFSDSTSSATMQVNQLRMWFSAMAYVLVDALRRIGPRHTRFADAAAAAIRAKLLKLGAQVPPPACGAFTSPSPRHAPTRTNSNLPISIFDVLSAPPVALANQKPQAPFLSALTRAQTDPHCGRTTTSRLELRDPEMTTSSRARETCQTF